MGSPWVLLPFVVVDFFHTKRTGNGELGEGDTADARTENDEDLSLRSRLETAHRVDTGQAVPLQDSFVWYLRHGE